MNRSFRVMYKGVKGARFMNFNINGASLTKDSAVLVTAAEFAPDEGMYFPGPFQTQGRPVAGAAPVYVTNVGPHGDGREQGGVEFMLHVDWGTPLTVIVTITVFDPIEQFVKA